MNTVESPEVGLAQYLESNTDAREICVAYSGGMDSHALLHAVSALIGSDAHYAIRAIHINHGLQTCSDEWADHCLEVCADLDIPLEVVNVRVVDQGDGPEASARLARYAAFDQFLSDSEHILLAQHADDQAETFLLQALRGSGPDGLASIPRKRKFGRAFMARPLLGCSRHSIETYAQNHGLSWVEDPSNNNNQYDRNFLRNEILPQLKSRWPAAAQTLSRAAMRCSAASQTMLGLAQEDLELVRVRGSAELMVSELKSLPKERAFNVLRLWVRQAGLRMPRLQDLIQVHSDLIDARVDSQGIVNVRDYEFRRYQDRLYLLPPQPAIAPFEYRWDQPFDELYIAETGESLTRTRCAELGVALPKNGSVVVRSRTGGELIKLGEPAFHKAVKKLLQESSVPPWEREAIPLLYVNDRLAAVWNIAVAIDFRVPARTGTDSSIDMEIA
ncbi:MAG: tRNA lysidine(34) synthetase TilS [Gammaproteobacteria bacterium]|nr:tRNA lysidine(34) synthetase TilS [Gammaproteobacteria bacterium]